MNDRGIPDAVRRFVISNIYSVEQLEILLHLHKNQSLEWSAEATSTALRTNPASTASRLADLHMRRLLTTRQDGRTTLFRFSASNDLKRSVDDLAKYYSSHSSRIIELIYSRPSESIQRFADAFRFRRRDEK